MELDPLETWKQVYPWRDHLALRILGLVDPDSNEAREYPHLHEVISDRLDENMAARGGDPVSKCHEKFATLRGTVRADSHEFQRRANNYHTEDDYNTGSNDPLHRMENMCQLLRDRMRPYATIGSGTYGSVFAARDVNSTNPSRNRYYAIKVETHWTMEDRNILGTWPTMTVIEDSGEYLYIPYEALLLLLVSSSDRFPTLNSVYVDKELHSTVMSVCVDHDLLRLEPDDIKKKLMAFTGNHIRYKKEPILNELEACKVASQLLEGQAYLRDMNLSHGDLSRNNYIIDENLNVRLIDLGMTSFSLDQTRHMKRTWANITALEHFMTPELAVELFKPHWSSLEQTKYQVDVYLTHDDLNEHMWRLAVLTYDALHGFAPWESPEWEPRLKYVDTLHNRDEDTPWPMLHERRDRVINEELPIDENLSQDCADALRAMLMKEPTDRPSLEEMCSLPWFNQWAYHTDKLFMRPYSELYKQDKVKKSIPTS